jgi:ABC-type branched-subunit amino acid transport system substrate-binding protein
VASTRYTSLPLAAMAVVTALALAACGGSDSSNSNSTPDAAAKSAPTVKPDPSKPVVKVGLIVAVGTAISDQPSVRSAAQAGVAALNARGGMHGHKVDLVYCNDKADPNQAATCARTMVQEKVVAMVGGYSIFDANSQPILDKAGIPMIGINAIAPQLFTADNVYLPSAPALVSYRALVGFAAKQGLQPASLIVSDTPGGRSLAKVADTTLKQASGGEGFADTVPLAPDTADFSPPAAALDAKKPKSAMEMVGIGQQKGLARALDSGGTQIQAFYSAPAFTTGDVKDLGSIGEKLITAQTYPPYSDPAMGQFVKEMKIEEGTGDDNAALSKMMPYGVDSWVALQIVDQMTKGMSSITAAGVKGALDKATSISVGSVLKDWNPNKQGPAGFTRVSNDSVYFIGFDNGNPIRLTDAPVSLDDAIAGKFTAKLPPAVEGGQ